MSCMVSRLCSTAMAGWVRKRSSSRSVSSSSGAFLSLIISLTNDSSTLISGRSSSTMARRRIVLTSAREKGFITMDRNENWKIAFAR